jgi:deazaflavin-dependent oxidoreductase (nitroreductase family)
LVLSQFLFNLLGGNPKKILATSTLLARGSTNTSALIDKYARPGENRGHQTYVERQDTFSFPNTEAWCTGGWSACVGALALGALAIGALAIGRFVIGRLRIQRLEIDELVVRRLQITDSLTAPRAAPVENDRPKKPEGERFNQPTALDRAINKLFGLFVGFGFGLPHNYLLQVRGRKSGRIYSTPVDLLSLNGKRYLVAPRGYTQWVRNANASGTVSLKKGRRSEEFGVRMLPDDEKPEILKSYLDRYNLTVQRYFPVPTSAPNEAFRSLAAQYPVFELIPPR